MSKYKVSIVEDNESLCHTIANQLTMEEGLRYLDFFPDGEAALKGLPESEADIVIMDIGLPDMSGVTCMVKLKAKNPKLRFLMFTIFENDANLFNALRAGAEGYVLKSDGTRGVINGIHELINGGAPMSRDIAVKVLNSFRKPNEVIEDLTPREGEALDLLSKGFLYKEIAVKMGVKEGTVKQYVHRIYQKLEVNNRTEAINKYLGH